MEAHFFTYQQRYRGENMDIKFELKKCPFCGGEAQMIIAKADTKLYGVECKRCHVLMGHTVNNSTEFFTMPLYAADAWNQRAEMTIEEVEQWAKQSKFTIVADEWWDAAQDIISKYQKIEQIANDKNVNGDLLRMSEIRWVLENGK